MIMAWLCNNRRRVEIIGIGLIGFRDEAVGGLGGINANRTFIGD